jgi:hypothetical protein
MHVTVLVNVNILTLIPDDTWHVMAVFKLAHSKGYQKGEKSQNRGLVVLYCTVLIGQA